MMKNRNYDTLSEAIKGLQAEGYTENLILKEDHLTCSSVDQKISANDFEVDIALRFEGKSNPDDASVLYAISSDRFGIKGLLVDAYGAYSSPLKTEIIQKLRYQP
ncbi:MAG: phosphoribosylpyrophosphate synthetase [Bacteroidia bacterium]